MPSIKTMEETPAKTRAARQGTRISQGTASSTAWLATTPSWRAAGGRWCRSQPRGDGDPVVSKWKERQSSLSHLQHVSCAMTLDLPAPSITRKASQRRSQRTVRGGAPSGQKEGERKMRRKPVSRI
eukprot:760129-Hanusia_phi.AAC.2